LKINAASIGCCEKEPILREYLRRWKMEAGQFFEGVGGLEHGHGAV
jgi:hypothetical protein